MRKRRKFFFRAGTALCVAVALALMTVSLTSCGGTKETKSSSAEKLPPGVSQSEVSDSSTPSESSTPSGSQPTTTDQGESTTTTEKQTSTPNASADLAGGRFTVVSATRPDSNKSVISSSSREVAGDYMEIKLTVQNVGTDLIDLSAYSFRLESPGIAADAYSDYYGDTGTYGKYVDENEISATLLDYSSLSAVAYKVKVGEVVDEVFVFFDLNPENVGRNAGVTKENTNLVIRKVSGTDYGDEVTIPLAGYPD